ncbi:YibE/F family protein [Hydrogenoanaerobacterium sp.]|uniref:YibE/F family protein n=1 Tax=Hydrogenoanaerobacterium sp. TaxID=2953763 RepID=UPI0028A0EDFC|nr:YibE/F family protein [Hydrogenoanaerobacterium sp.]
MLKLNLKIEKHTRNRAIVYVLTVLFSILFIYFGNGFASQGMTLFEGASMEKPVKAQVVEVQEPRTDSYSLDEGETSVQNIYIDFSARILNGWQKGQVVECNQTIDGFTPIGNKEVEVGDRVLIFHSDPSSASSIWMFWDYIRTDTLLILGLVFMALLLLFGRGKGVNTIISLVFTCLAVFLVFIPSILTGRNAYISSIVVCLFTIVMTLLIVNGANAKGLAAGVGCLGGILVSGALTLIMDYFLRLTGLVDEESIFLLYMDTPKPIDLKAIIFAAIIIGALGAIMDVAMSIASSLAEVRDIMEVPTFGALMKSGIQIGRDIMGTMANTLVLAYIGSSLSMVLLLIAYNNSLLGLLNKEMIVVEILQTLVGSMGILFTIPLTSAISAFVYTRAGGNHQKPAQGMQEIE